MFRSMTIGDQKIWTYIPLFLKKVLPSLYKGFTQVVYQTQTDVPHTGDVRLFIRIILSEVGADDEIISVGGSKIHWQNAISALCIVGEIGVDLWVDGIGHGCNAGDTKNQWFVAAGEIDIQC